MDLQVIRDTTSLIPQPLDLQYVGRSFFLDNNTIIYDEKDLYEITDV